MHRTSASSLGKRDPDGGIGSKGLGRRDRVGGNGSEGSGRRERVGGIGLEGSGRRRERVGGGNGSEGSGRDPDRGFYKKISKSTNNLELFTWFFQALLYTNISGFSLVRPNELFTSCPLPGFIIDLPVVGSVWGI